MDLYLAQIGNSALFLMMFSLLFITSDDDDVVEDVPEPVDPSEFFGTELDDNIVASEPELKTFLLGGNDTYVGTVGQDVARGGSGNDTLKMGFGNDIAYGGDDNDTIDGGFGDDTLYGDAGHDNLNGSKGDDTVYGGSGNDSVNGSSGSDYVYGGDGNDTINGYIGDDTVSDNPQQLDGVDHLFGGSGDDILILGSNDVGEGGDGIDTFVLDQHIEAGEFTTITDYNTDDDALIFEYTPQTDPDTGLDIVPNLTSVDVEDGSGSMLLNNGVAVASITGQTGFDVTQVQLVAV